MSPEDIAIFFSPGDPGIEEAFYQDSDNQPQSVHGEFICHSKAHVSGTRHITQKKPAFKLPESQAVNIPDKADLLIKGLHYEVSERLTVAADICLLYLVEKAIDDGEAEAEPHRWQ